MRADASRRQTLAMVLRYVGRNKIYLILSLLLCVITVASTLYVPILTGNVVDRLLGPGQVDFEGLIPLLAAIGALVAVTALSQWLMGLCNNRMTYRTVRDIRTDAFRRIQRLPLRYLDAHPTGDVISRVITDVDQFADGLLMGFTQLFSGVLTIAGTLGFMYRPFGSSGYGRGGVTPHSLGGRVVMRRAHLRHVHIPGPDPRERRR